jgi:hypothetical protein
LIEQLEKAEEATSVDGEAVIFSLTQCPSREEVKVVVPDSNSVAEDWEIIKLL